MCVSRRYFQSNSGSTKCKFSTKYIYKFNHFNFCLKLTTLYILQVMDSRRSRQSHRRGKHGFSARSHKPETNTRFVFKISYSDTTCHEISNLHRKKGGKISDLTFPPWCIRNIRFSRIFTQPRIVVCYRRFGTTCRVKHFLLDPLRWDIQVVPKRR